MSQLHETVAANDPAAPDGALLHSFVKSKAFALRLKKIVSFWTARVGLHYRVLARDRTEGLVWFWIGHYSEYDHIIRG